MKGRPIKLADFFEGAQKLKLLMNEHCGYLIGTGGGHGRWSRIRSAMLPRPTRLAAAA